MCVRDGVWYVCVDMGAVSSNSSAIKLLLKKPYIGGNRVVFSESVCGMAK